MNLIPAILEMEDQIVKIKQKHAEKLKEIEDGLIALRKLNTVCERCSGDKTISKPRACAEDDDKYNITCPKCHGTGKAR